MKLSLVVAQGAKEGTVIPILVPQFLIGRDPQCQLRPGSEAVSKKHCALTVKSGKVFAKDLGSRNGTFVNDQKIAGDVELKNEDKLKVGPLLFVVRLEVKAQKPAGKQRSGPLADDDIADMLLDTASSGPPAGKTGAMLLDLPDTPREGTEADADGVPTGSTQMELPAMTDTAKEGGTGDKKPADKPSGDTASAAKAILEKYARRNRR